MNTSLFSKLGWLCQPNFEKREIGGGGGLPRAAAAEALPWADIRLPFQGAGPRTNPGRCHWAGRVAKGLRETFGAGRAGAKNAKELAREGQKFSVTGLILMLYGN